MRLPRNLYNPLTDDYDEVGEPVAIGVGLDASGGEATMLTVPAGQCFLVQRIVGQGMTFSVPTDISPVLYSPGVTGTLFDVVSFNDAANTTQWSLQLRPFLRPITVFGTVSPVIWKSAEPNAPLNWRFKHPLCVPSGWTIKGTQSSTIGNNYAVYGRMVSEAAARSLGYTVSSTATDADRTCGLDSLSHTFTTTQIIVPARTGYSIQILDIHMRLQPVAAVLTNSTMTVEQGDGRAIFVLANNNPGDFVEKTFSPGIYLKSGTSLNAKSSTALTGNVIVSWRYVPDADVPSDHWWACVEPGLPTPATSAVGASELGRATSHEVTCFYPKLNVTKTSPTTGFQHFLRGYMVSIQKDAMAATAEPGSEDFFLCRISTGTSGSVIGLSTLHSITDTGIPLTPLFVGVSHDQVFAIVVDDVNLPGVKDTGSLWIDSLGFGAATIATPTTTVGIDEFWVTLWGKTIPTRFSNPSNRGAAS